MKFYFEKVNEISKKKKKIIIVIYHRISIYM